MDDTIREDEDLLVETRTESTKMLVFTSNDMGTIAVGMNGIFPIAKEDVASLAADITGRTDISFDIKPVGTVIDSNGKIYELHLLKSDDVLYCATSEGDYFPQAVGSLSENMRAIYSICFYFDYGVLRKASVHIEM